MLAARRGALVALVVLGWAINVHSQGAGMKDDNLSPDSLLKKADEVFQSHDYKEALNVYKRTVDAARGEFNRPVEVEALSQVARMNLLLNNPDEGNKWLAEARDKAVESDSMGWSRYLGVRGRFEWKSDDLAAARQTFEQMYEYCGHHNLWARGVDAAHMVAIVSELPEDQIQWGRRGIEMAEEHATENWLGPLWNNLAGTYYDNKQYDSALECYLKARDYHWRFSDETSKLFADYHVGMTYRLLGKLDDAAKWLRPVLAWAERIDNHAAMAQAFEDLGEIAVAKGDTSGGLAMLKRSREEFKADGYPDHSPDKWKSINDRIAALEKR